ncbi:septum formation initiator family protein [Streptomyces rubiginosohelvolus]|uniref:FtsB family cell division protein n=1 Tax=Streptomyces TaxID=1883 RepID=UPI0021B2E475|nr:septum formation initiator family protein [Streptomyces sp. CS-7]MCT6776793.1 septum formation initiator family protein [Streptomyces sp. CS-7]
MSKPAAPLKGRAARLARLMPSTGPSTAARTPFVLLVVLLLGGGLITLLLLNSALNEGSFRLSELKRDTTELTDEQQALQRDVDSRSQPDALEKRARELGMVPGGNPAFLNPDGTVRGKPTEATAPPPSPSPSPTPSPSASPDADAPAAGPSASGTSAGPSGSPSPSGSVSATTPDPAAAPSAENSPPPTSPGR